MLGLLAAVALSGPFHRPDTRHLPGRIWGVTVDNIDAIDATVDSLRSLRAKPTVRMVFDPGTSPAYYMAAAGKVHTVADVMGSPIDSAPPSGQMTVEAYRKRMADYMDGLGDRVDLWEIGNEVNGDWTGDSALMGQKIAAAYQEANRRHKPTALTVFYSDVYVGQEREMSTWSRKNIPDSVRDGIDYVLVSFYPDTATGSHPDWSQIFTNLGQAFPKARLGFGELGLRNADFSLSNDTAAKGQLIRRYYGMTSPLSGAAARRYCGGYFWWTYRQDAGDKSFALWQAFHDVIR